MFKIPKYQLYLLQLENYELGRYFRLLFRKGLWPKGEQRKDLVWTLKAGLVFSIACALYLIFPFLIVFAFFGRLPELGIKNYELGILLLTTYYLLLTTFFLLYTVAVLLLWPFDFLVKQFIVARAKYKIKSLAKLKIIGIAGSYGKTTMKEVLASVLSAKFKVLSTPESVNTPVGIARWVLKKFDDALEIAIVEMGEHYRGDVEAICKIGKPGIAVVTGINEAHLERMKKIEIITDTIFEIVDSSKPGAMVVLNADDENVINNYKKYIWPDHKLLFFGTKNKSNFQFPISNFQFNTEKLDWDAEAEGIGKVFINLLGEYALADASAAIIIAKSLGMTDEEIKKGIERIKPVEHRLQPIKSAGNVLVIDDSYNGNPQGAAEAIRVLSRFENRRKVYITPGLVEMGKAAPDIHREIGKQLAQVADVVILIKNSVTSYIESGIMNYELGTIQRRPQIVWFNTAQEAHVALSQILKPGDVVLFQNDWGDQYI